ncbi:hypothetical protein J4Q44_G00182340 [Coregonus suidteri]|uniref:Ion transport domain-containing protein n=1 Tax=Coregonus suidteri TaxID=861788 RepID=A0AAN8LJB8_9TELE
MVKVESLPTRAMILTQEDWNVVLYNGMASTSPLAALYFVALMTFGNYVLFNLLVAILVEGFQAEGDANRSEADDEKLSTFEEEEKMKELYAAELKLQAMMLTPNGLLNPRASMPLPHTQSPWQQPPPPSPWQRPPLIFHTVATPTTCNSQSRRGSAVSTDTSNALDPRSPSPWDSRRSSWSSIGRGPSLQQRKSQSSERDSLLSEGAGSEWSNPSWGRSREESFDLLDQSDDHEDDEEDAEESVCVRVKLFLEPYKPQWCRDHEDWALYLFSPCNRFRQWCQRVITHKMFDHIILLFIFLNCITIALERPDVEPHSTERVFLSVSNHIFTVIFIAEMTVKVVALGLYSGEAVYLKSSWNLFKGKFFHCEGVDVRNVTNRTDCLQAGHRWTRRKYNFDNLGQPVRNHNPWMLLFFISFLLIVSFFVLNMFVGVVVENFHKCRQDQEEEEARAREEKRAKRAEKRRRTEETCFCPKTP